MEHALRVRWGARLERAEERGPAVERNMAVVDRAAHGNERGEDELRLFVGDGECSVWGGGAHLIPL